MDQSNYLILSFFFFKKEQICSSALWIRSRAFLRLLKAVPVETDSGKNQTTIIIIKEHLEMHLYEGIKLFYLFRNNQVDSS
jgi:hypothetical protein